MEKHRKGAFIISIDYELMWGVKSFATPSKYGVSNIANVRYAIDEMLFLFSKYGIHATFATVGMLMCDNKEEALALKPIKTPEYENINMSPFSNNYVESIDMDKYGQLYFEPDVIKQLLATEGIEVASHTFSHYFCWEKGQTVEQFEHDCIAMKKIAKKYNTNFESIVFPRNAVSSRYLKVCSKYGIKNYRGNSTKFFSRPRNKAHKIFNKGCRFLDSYINLGGHTTIPYTNINTKDIPLNIPASRFLRPYSPKLKFFDNIKLNRIKSEIKYAAKNGELYHIWWHPHNMGNNVAENLRFLEKILRYFYYCKQKYGMNSFNMSEFADYIKQ